jgi:hypothetical protein
MFTPLPGFVEATLTAYETVTDAVFVPLLYVEELAESGV